MIKKNSNNSFKTFVSKLLVFFIIFFFVDLLIGNLLKKFYFQQESGMNYLTTFSIEKTTTDVVIFGSSRATNIFNTKIFEVNLNMPTYNAGRDGEPIFYHYAILKAILNRYKPKIIVLSMDEADFSKNSDDYDRISVLLPYYKSHPEIRPIITLKRPFEKLKLLSNIYPYNSLMLSIIGGNNSFNKNQYANGFIPLRYTISGPLQTYDYSKEIELDSTKINIYKSFIQDCINANISLYIICSPYIINSIGKDLSIIKAIAIAKEYNIDFFDYSRDTFYTTKPELFADYRHLNEKGVEIFSNTVAEKIKYKTLGLKRVNR